MTRKRYSRRNDMDITDINIGTFGDAKLTRILGIDVSAEWTPERDSSLANFIPPGGQLGANDTPLSFSSVGELCGEIRQLYLLYSGHG